MTVSVFVPSDLNRHDILPGSAIVGAWEFMVGRVMLDYEGNKYDAANLRRFVERCYHAWSRHVERYPTVARIYVQGAEVIEVGTFDPERKIVTLNPLDEPKLVRWLGFTPDEWLAAREQELVY